MSIEKRTVAFTAPIAGPMAEIASVTVNGVKFVKPEHQLTSSLEAQVTQTARERDDARRRVLELEEQVKRRSSGLESTLVLAPAPEPVSDPSSARHRAAHVAGLIAKAGKRTATVGRQLLEDVVMAIDDLRMVADNLKTANDDLRRDNVRLKADLRMVADNLGVGRGYYCDAAAIPEKAREVMAAWQADRALADAARNLLAEPPADLVITLPATKSDPGTTGSWVPWEAVKARLSPK